MKSQIPGQMGGTDCVPTPKRRPQSRRSHSFSFSLISTSNSFQYSSSPSSFESISSPTFSSSPDHKVHYYSPSNSPVASGVPFSWEQHPGIPKTLISTNSHDSPSSSSSNSSSSVIPRKCNPSVAINNTLPLPPPVLSAKKLNMRKTPRDGLVGDPFALALMKCCAKDIQPCEVNMGGNWKSSSKVDSRTLSDRFGFINLYASCKRTSDVLESKILRIPRPSRLVGRN